MFHQQEPSSPPMPGIYQPRRLSSDTNSTSSSSINTVRQGANTKVQGAFSHMGLGNSPRGSSERNTPPAGMRAQSYASRTLSHENYDPNASSQDEVGETSAWQANAGKCRNHPDDMESEVFSKGIRHARYGQASNTSPLGRSIGNAIPWRTQDSAPAGISYSPTALLERPEKRNIRRNGSPVASLHEARAEMPFGRKQEGLVPRRIRSISEREKKMMLSKALHKANDAVLLDNSQNYRDAIGAYEQACSLLVHVMGRTVSEEDKNKLSAIRNTYANRIAELQRLGLTKGSGSSTNTSSAQPSFQSLNSAVENGDMSPVVTNANLVRAASQSASAAPTDQGFEAALVASGINHNSLREYSKSSSSDHYTTSSQTASWVSDSVYGDGTKRSIDESADILRKEPRATAGQAEISNSYESGPVNGGLRERQLPQSDSIRTRAWYEVEATQARPSKGSPHHSVSSFEGLHRKRLHARTDSDATEAAFDAALDAAVEAAYGEGYEPYDDRSFDNEGFHTATSWSNEAIDDTDHVAKAHLKRQVNGGTSTLIHANLAAGLEAGHAEDEERILEELTKGFSLRDASFEPRSRSNLPRGSDSSSFSNTTFASSATSSMTAGTSLFTVDESSSLQGPRKSLQHRKSGTTSGAPAPPPQGPLPLPPVSSLPASHIASQDIGLDSSSVQERRGTGPLRKLTIETAVTSSAGVKPLSAGSTASSTRGGAQYASPVTPEKPSSKALRSERITSLTSSLQSTSPQTLSRQTSPSYTIRSPLGPGRSPTSNLSLQGSNRPSPNSGSPANRMFGSKPYDRSHAERNTSSLSLKHRPVLTSMSEDMQSEPTSVGYISSPSPANRPSAAGVSTNATPLAHVRAGMHRVTKSNSSTQTTQPAPRSLEPCPESSLLRPFWLMRCLYETVTHPKGGYLTNKLFIPREVWKMNNVKLKHVEDKIFNIQLLTDALAKLGARNIMDTDVVLHELQILEHVLDQVQTNLTKKLGSDVGPQTTSTMFKEIPGGESMPAYSADNSKKESRPSGKSVLASWRKLRGKPPSTMHETLGQSSAANRESSQQADSWVLPTVPMTTMNGVVSARQARRGTQGTLIRAEGPNSSYMSAIARLCDAVQVLDQIARQVEDPDLKHSSPTRMGLELSVRHAAEFFGFYICRFILQDITMLVNKLLKRSTEWVLT